MLNLHTGKYNNVEIVLQYGLKNATFVYAVGGQAYTANTTGKP
jgi:hypothetical protein